VPGTGLFDVIASAQTFSPRLVYTAGPSRRISIKSAAFQLYFFTFNTCSMRVCVLRDGGMELRSSSRAMPQGLDQRSNKKEVMPKIARRLGSDAIQSRRRLLDP